MFYDFICRLTEILITVLVIYLIMKCTYGSGFKSLNNLTILSNNIKKNRTVLKKLNTASKLVFGSRFSKILEFRKLKADGSMQIFYSTGLIGWHHFNNESILYGLARFNGNNGSACFNVPVFYTKDRNIIYGVANASTRFSFTEINGNGFIHNGPYFDSKLQGILNNQSYGLKMLFSSHKRRFHEKDKKFWHDVKEGKNTGNFVCGNINRNNPKVVSETLNLASNRALGKSFITILGTPRLVLAFGTMYVTLPVGLEQKYNFNGDKVYFAIAQLLTENEGCIEVPIFYKFSCFNPIRATVNVDSSDVTFKEIDGTEIKINIPIFDKRVTQILNRRIDEIKTKVFKEMSTKNQKKVFFANPGTPFPPDYKIVQESNSKGVFFSGLLINGFFQQGDFSKINVEDYASEFVPEGDYPSCEDAFKKAVKFTFDAIAIMPGYYVEIYANKNRQGGTVFSGHGPLIIANNIWINHPTYKGFQNFVLDEFHQTIFPPGTRIWSKTDMHDWQGSVSIIKS